MDEVTVGIDIGTTSVKAVAAAVDGTILARCRLPHAVIAPDASRFEHDAAAVWREAVRAAWEQVRAGLEVRGVCVAAMVPSLCGLDSDGTPVTPGLLYGDARGRDDDDEALGFAQSLASGPRAPAFLWPAQATANHALCGVGAIDTTTAMTLLPLFDGVGWDPDVCARLGVQPEQLPGLSPGTAPIGAVDGALVAGGAVDAFAEQLVADAHAPGDVLVICGTTLIPWALTEGWPEVEGLWTIPFTIPGIAAVGGASNAGGLFIEAVRRITGDVPLDSVDPRRVPVWLPYLRGERTPWHDPARRAELFGFELGMGGAEVLQAAYEASGFVVRHHLDLAGVDPSPSRIVAAGGGAHAAAWVQALADTTGLPVDVSAVPEGAALGAAFLARMTAGLETDINAGRAWARIARRVEPRPAWAEASAVRYEAFRDRAGARAAARR